MTKENPLAYLLYLLKHYFISVCVRSTGGKTAFNKLFYTALLYYVGNTARHTHRIIE